MSAAERRALFLLLVLGLAGQGVRWWLARPGDAPGDVQLLAALPPRSPIPHRDSILALARPLGPDERIDVDRAGAEELARLPRVGLGLAKRIVADRAARGPFGGPGGLDRVPGVGTGLLAAIGPHLAFSGRPAAPSQGATTIAPGPGGAAGHAASPPPSGPNSGGRPVDLNTADAAALDALPGVGPARARAVVEYRQANGPFRALQDLAKVPGFGPAALNRLQALVRVGGQ
jgi:competence ComEA-like helix-hairpin-helix protein